MSQAIIGSVENAVTIAGLKSVDAEKFFAFDGITATLTGGAVENFSNLTIMGGANNVRRVIWQGEVDGVRRAAVLIVNNDGDVTLKGGWLILSNEQNVLTYYIDAAKISAESAGNVEEDAGAIIMQFPEKKISSYSAQIYFYR